MVTVRASPSGSGGRGTRTTLAGLLWHINLVSVAQAGYAGPVIIVLHPDQAAEVRLLAADLDLPVDEVVRHLLSGPLLDEIAS